jgi:hypothetical protein
MVCMLQERVDCLELFVKQLGDKPSYSMVVQQGRANGAACAQLTTAKIPAPVDRWYQTRRVSTGSRMAVEIQDRKGRCRWYKLPRPHSKSQCAQVGTEMQLATGSQQLLLLATTQQSARQSASQQAEHTAQQQSEHTAQQPSEQPA